MHQLELGVCGVLPEAPGGRPELPGIFSELHRRVREDPQEEHPRSPDLLLPRDHHQICRNRNQSQRT